MLTVSLITAIIVLIVASFVFGAMNKDTLMNVFLVIAISTAGVVAIVCIFAYPMKASKAWKDGKYDETTVTRTDIQGKTVVYDGKIYTASNDKLTVRGIDSYDERLLYDDTIRKSFSDEYVVLEIYDTNGTWTTEFVTFTNALSALYFNAERFVIVHKKGLPKD